MRSTAAATPAFRIFKVDYGTVSIPGLTISNGFALGTNVRMARTEVIFLRGPDRPDRSVR